MSVTITEERRTYDLPVAARLLGISEWNAGKQIRRTGSLAGVGVIRVGRRILIPRDAFDRVLAGEDRTVQDAP